MTEMVQSKKGPLGHPVYGGRGLRGAEKATDLQTQTISLEKEKYLNVGKTKNRAKNPLQRDWTLSEN